MATSTTGEVLKNQDVLNFFTEHGRNQCVQYLKEKNPENLKKPTEQSYINSIHKVSAVSKNLRKSIKRPNGALKYEHFLNDTYLFPVYEENKRVAKTTATETLNMTQSFIKEKTKNKTKTKTMQMNNKDQPKKG